jgi:predicted ABC-type ATPase
LLPIEEIADCSILFPSIGKMNVYRLSLLPRIGEINALRFQYVIRLLYLWIPDPSLAVARIRDRVDGGGHDVPEPDVRRRYGRTLNNFFDIYRPVSNSVHFFNNTGEEPELVFKDEDGDTEIYNPVLYRALIAQWSKS